MKEGRYAEASALDAVVCGACWHHGRQGLERTCLWCGQADTPQHRYWECKRLAKHESSAVEKTNKYKATLVAKFSWADCLWSRAVLPMTLGRWRPDTLWEDETTQKQTYNYTRMAKENHDIATDGSGGPAFVPSSLTKVGAGIAIIDLRRAESGKCIIKEVALQTSSVPGGQTVPRAELYGLIKARAAAAGAQIPKNIWSDSEYTVKGATRDSKDKLCSGSNGDLWQLADGLEDGNLRTCKVKAHAEKEVLQGTMCPSLYLRNALADAAADASTELMVEPLACQEAEKWEGVAYNVAMRLAAIEAEVWAKTPLTEWVRLEDIPEPEPPDEEQLAAELRRGIQAQGHELRVKTHFAHCTRCRCRKKIKNMEVDANAMQRSIQQRSDCQPSISSRAGIRRN